MDSTSFSGFSGPNLLFVFLLNLLHVILRVLGLSLDLFNVFFCTSF